MASTSRYTSPPLSPPRRTAGVVYPTTPQPNVRLHGSDTLPGSPSSDTASSTNLGIFRTSSSAGTLHLPPSDIGLTNFSLANSTRKVIIRSDPTMVTCFDPADQELYNLWAPRR